MSTVSTAEERAVTELLDRAGVMGNGVLFVHSAFRQLGAAGFRAEAFIEALIDYMRAGTLVMPTMTWRVVTPANPWFDELETISHVGILAELFRRHYANSSQSAPDPLGGGMRPARLRTNGTHHIGDTPCALLDPMARPGRPMPTSYC